MKMSFLGFLICFVSAILIGVSCSFCSNFSLQVREKAVDTKLNFHPGSRISGGLLADINEFPWHVYIMANGAGVVSTCGGSVLNENWILTAAHCTHDYHSLDMYFGAVDVYSMPTIISSTYWIEHDGYNRVNYNNDIAVAQLETSLSYSSNIQPIALISPASAENEFIGETATVLGFGYTTDDNPEESPDLLYTRVVVIPNSNCSQYYGDGIVTNNTLCAKGQADRSHSICSGDSGGAMVIGNATNEHIQIGINSFIADSGCTTGSPSGYVRIGSYLQWIEDKTGVRVTRINPANMRLRMQKIDRRRQFIRVK